MHKDTVSLNINNNAYPESLPDAYNMVLQYDLAKEDDKSKHHGPKPKRKEQPSNVKDKPTDEPNSSQVDNKETTEGVSLFQATSKSSTKESTADTDDVQLDKKQFQLLQQEIDLEKESDYEPKVHFMLNQSHRPRSKKNLNWILLDSESTCHIFNNRKFLKNIRSCAVGECITISSNGIGSLEVTQIDDVPGVGTVYFHPKSVANVLSLAKIAKDHHVVFDSSNENAFTVHGKHSIVKFVQRPSGLYYFDASVNGKHNTLVTIVQLAKQLYALVGRPGHDVFLDMFRHNRLKNCPIDVEDANRAILVYGHDIAALRGKANHQQPIHETPHLVSPVPPAILLIHKHIQLCVDVCFINNIIFLVSISRSIKLKTVDQIADTSDASVLPSLRQVLNIYTSRCFIVDYIHANNGFRGLSDQPLPSRLNLTSAGEHVPDVERFICTLKGKCRTTCHSLPYRCH